MPSLVYKPILSILYHNNFRLILHRFSCYHSPVMHYRRRWSASRRSCSLAPVWPRPPQQILLTRQFRRRRRSRCLWSSLCWWQLLRWQCAEGEASEVAGAVEAAVGESAITIEHLQWYIPHTRTGYLEPFTCCKLTHSISGMVWAWNYGIWIFPR